MRVVAINGSPRGKASTTALMIDALLDGFRSGGSDVTSVDLAERDIRQCRGCHRCWTVTPGICVQEDDMRSVIDAMRGAEFFVFGSPVYFGNVSGTLKTFFDRLTAAGGDPHAAAASPAPTATPRYVMVSNCGFPDRSQFDVVSLWIRRVAAMSKAELAGEFYVAGGRALSAPGPGHAQARNEYLEYLCACGACFSANGSLSSWLAARGPFTG